jgi:hypothetical protein
MWLWILSRALLIIGFLAMCLVLALIGVTWRDVMYEFDDLDDEDLDI